MPELIEKLNSWQQRRPVGHYFSVVSPQPTYMRPDIVGPGVFKDDFDKVLNLMPNNDRNKIAWDYMKSIADQVEQAEPNVTELLKLKTFLDEKDRRRETNWQTIFPWLVEVFEKSNVR